MGEVMVRYVFVKSQNELISAVGSILAHSVLALLHRPRPRGRGTRTRANTSSRWPAPAWAFGTRAREGIEVKCEIFFGKKKKLWKVCSVSCFTDNKCNLMTSVVDKKKQKS